MPSLTNNQRKSNGRVSPMDAETIERINNPTMIPIDTKENVTSKSFIYRLLKKKEEKQTKPEGPKLKSFEIVSERVFY